MKDGFKNTEEYNPWKKRKALIVFYNMIADIVTELFIWGRKSNLPNVFITQSYFKVPKDVRPILHIFYYENSK